MKSSVAVACFLVISSSACPAEDVASQFYQVIRSGDLAGLRAEIQRSGPNVRDKRGTTPLMYASAVGNIDAMKALIAAGADVRAKNSFDVTSLMWCATEEAKVSLLIKKGADVNGRSTQGRTALLIAASTDGNSRIVKLLLDHGADLKKADADPVSTPLTAAANADDTATVRLLLEHGAEVHGPAGAFAVITAAGHGNVQMMKLLIERGAPPDAVSPPVTEHVKNGDIALGSFTALLISAANGGPDAVRYLLDQKVNVNAQDVRGMTPLMLALALDHPDPQVIRLLLEHGADPQIKSKAGETAADWARKFNNPEILKILGIEAAAPHSLAFSPSPAAPRQAVQNSVDLLQRTAASFFIAGGCSSCHAHNLTSMALAAARTSGIRVDSAAEKARAEQTKVSWSTPEQNLLIRMDAPGGHNMTAYGILQFAADAVKPNTTTDAMVHNIAAQQQLSGNWHNDGVARPPMADGDFTHTAIAIRALAAYGIPARRTEFSERISRGADWLRHAKPVTAEDYNMQLLGLRWAGETRSLSELATKIIAMQRADGGWAQTPYLGSDAYATGQTLVALKEAGIPMTNSAYKRGAEFLLRTQLSDGSWHVISRAPKFQPYFQSGFPHDHDQWISMAGTAWATLALASTL